ncbi:MAG: hypothetical protein Q4D38_14115 [Planctomycetia bacterium]|nr:hypothetical protein [Planctomycetia bacterium]
MSYFIAKTGEFSATGTRDPKTRDFDVKFKLVSTGGLSPGDAWGCAWNQLRLKYPFFRGCKLKSVQVEGKAESCGCMYDVTAHYSYADEETDPYFATLSFSMRGGREKKIHAFDTTSYQAVHELLPPPDFQHAIGYDNGIFQGVDVVVPTNGFSVDVDLPNSAFSAAQLAWCWSVTGAVNAAPLWGFRRGELLFLGPTGNSYRKKNENDQYELWWRLSFEFDAQPSITNANIPPFQNITKEGHQYFWTFCRDKKDPASGITIPVPVAAYVETVYPYADFSWFANLHW